MPRILVRILRFAVRTDSNGSISLSVGFILLLVLGRLLSNLNGESPLGGACPAFWYNRNAERAVLPLKEQMRV